jgi:DNA-directed RNA polymerase subunit RPC12/RpoP
MAGASRPPIRAVSRGREGEPQPIVVGACMLALVRCRECDSKLLQLERIWLLADGRRVADRRCPECGTRDRVTVGAFATKLWLAREQRFRRDLIEAADRLARSAGLPVAAFVRTPRS